MTSIFGAIVPQSLVEQAVLDTLNTWLDSYLAELERQLDLTVGMTQRPRAYDPSFDLENWEELQLPAVVVTCRAPAPFERCGGDRYNATFPVDIGVFVNDQSEQLVRVAAQRYQAAIGAVLVQNGSLGGVATETNMVGWDLRLPDPNNRTFALAVVETHIQVDGILTGTAGPAAPDPAASTAYGGAPEAPFTLWPQVETPELTIVGEAP